MNKKGCMMTEMIGVAISLAFGFILIVLVFSISQHNKNISKTGKIATTQNKINNHKKVEESSKKTSQLKQDKKVKDEKIKELSEEVKKLKSDSKKDVSVSVNINNTIPKENASWISSLGSNVISDIIAGIVVTLIAYCIRIKRKE